MRTKFRFTIFSLVLSTLGIAATSNTANAQARPTPPATADAGVTGTRTAPPGMAALARANAAFAARDWAAALNAFREAQQHQEQRVEATLGVGSTLAQQQNADGALASYREAVDLTAGASAVPLSRVRALQALASHLEAMARWADALAAWNEFVTYAEAHPTVANAGIGRARVQAIQARDERERADSQVRARIEERRRRNAQSPQGGATP